MSQSRKRQADEGFETVRSQKRGTNHLEVNLNIAALNSDKHFILSEKDVFNSAFSILLNPQYTLAVPNFGHVVYITISEGSTYSYCTQKVVEALESIPIVIPSSCELYVRHSSTKHGLFELVLEPIGQDGTATAAEDYMQY